MCVCACVQTRTSDIIARFPLHNSLPGAGTTIATSSNTERPQPHHHHAHGGGAADGSTNGSNGSTAASPTPPPPPAAAPGPAVVPTDSGYSHGVLCRNWKAKANQELILDLRARLQGRPGVEVAWVAGHVGIAGNERADQLANAGADGLTRTRWLDTGAS